MNKTLEVLKKIYKPYRYTIKNKCTIIETTSGKFVLKEKKNDIPQLFNYLKSRNFDNFPNLVEGNRDELNVYEYIEDINTPKEQKALDLIELVVLLHTKTTYYKEVSLDTYQEIYDNIYNNLQYLKTHYQKLIDDIFLEIYMSPSHYLLIRNSSKILAAIEFSEKELKEWFELVKNETRQRVCLIHNNLHTDHLIRNQKDYLISWEKSRQDSPVLDLIQLYKNEHFDLNFQEILNRYLLKYPLNEAEKKLFFIVISIPQEIQLIDNEFKACNHVKDSLDYLFKTEELTRPYYTPEDIKE